MSWWLTEQSEWMKYSITTTLDKWLQLAVHSINNLDTLLNSFLLWWCLWILLNRDNYWFYNFTHVLLIFPLANNILIFPCLAARLGNELMTYMKRYEIKPFRNFLVPLAQVRKSKWSIFLLFWFYLSFILLTKDYYYYYYYPIYGSNKSVWKLLVLDKNTWNHITVYELFVLRIVTRSYNCLWRIIINYIKPYNHLQIILFTNPSAWAGYDTRSIFKRSLTGLNSEFSFS